MALRSSGTDAQFLRNMQCGCNYEKLSAVGHINLGLLQSFEKDGGEQCFLDFMVRNFQYATHHRRRMLPSVEDIFEKVYAIMHEAYPTKYPSLY